MIIMNKCKICNYEWKSKTIIGFIPKSCPKCKRYDWQKKEGEQNGRQTN
jgi:predicted Zn-ribbon and HTH transcriptional regulator